MKTHSHTKRNSLSELTLTAVCAKSLLPDLPDLADNLRHHLRANQIGPHDHNASAWSAIKQVNHSRMQNHHVKSWQDFLFSTSRGRS